MILLVDEQKGSEVAELVQRAEDRVERANSRENAVGVVGLALVLTGGFSGYLLGEIFDLQGTLPTVLGFLTGGASAITLALTDFCRGSRAEKALSELKERQREIQV